MFLHPILYVLYRCKRMNFLERCPIAHCKVCNENAVIIDIFVSKISWCLNEHVENRKGNFERNSESRTIG